CAEFRQGTCEVLDLSLSSLNHLFDCKSKADTAVHPAWSRLKPSKELCCQVSCWQEEDVPGWRIFHVAGESARKCKK
ncbi:hypothetical protein HGM15179_017743, partial [Zosterops borbonicus]